MQMEERQQFCQIFTYYCREYYKGTYLTNTYSTTIRSCKVAELLVLIIGLLSSGHPTHPQSQDCNAWQLAQT